MKKNQMVWDYHYIKVLIKVLLVFGNINTLIKY